MKEKYILFLLLVGVFNMSIAQVAIGKDAVEGSALIDFAQDNNKGLILPTTNEVNLETGSLTLHRGDAQVYFVDANLEKVPLTGFETVDMSQLKEEKLSNNVEEPQGIIVGAETSEANGVLILESADKALVLPKVNNPAVNMPNPEPGTICYDTNSQSVAIFDGTNWYFWNQNK